MTNVKHHLTDALLMAYSAGALPEGFNLVVASHISLCDECRARMHAFDSLGGHVIDNETPQTMSAASLNATLNMIDAQVNVEKSPKPLVAKQIRSNPNTFPKPLRDYVGGDLDAVNWRSMGGGIQQSILIADKAATVRLLRIPAGMAVPDHGHRGTELTLVLQGAFHDETDNFGVGDIEVANEELNHQPVADEGLDCICLAATDAPLRFNSWLHRVAQPFLRV